MPEPRNYKHRPVLHGAVFLCLTVVVCAVIAMVHPKTPLPPAWNPTQPLNVRDPLTAMTSWKMTRALGARDACLSALATGGDFETLPDFEESEQCHIRPQVRLRGVGKAQIAPINTRCQTALRLVMWEHHGVQPAALRHLDTEVRKINHFSSYSCRQIRTTGGNAPRMSTHATANAIDISGFDLANGQRLSLLKDWNGSLESAAFFREVRDSACTWFRVTLGPDYNELHADHFHLQHSGFGLCR